MWVRTERAVTIVKNNLILRKKYLNIFYFSIYKFVSMSKSQLTKNKNKQLTNRNNENNSENDSFITLDKNKNILLKILAKPGAKVNNITDISIDGIGVQINAPPKEGEANKELLKYMTSIFGLRKGDIQLEKGSKSRVKILKIIPNDNTSIESIKEQILMEIKQ